MFSLRKKDWTSGLTSNECEGIWILLGSNFRSLQNAELLSTWKSDILGVGSQPPPKCIFLGNPRQRGLFLQDRKIQLDKKIELSIGAFSTMKLSIDQFFVTNDQEGV